MRNQVKVFLTILFATTILLFSAKSQAQTLDETLNNLSQQAGEAYVQPIISAFGSNLNSGWFSGSPGNKLLGFDLNIKLMASASFFSDANKTFNVSAPFRFNSQQADQILANSGYSSSSSGYKELKNAMLSQEFKVNVSGPTIVGSSGEHLKIKFPGATIDNKTVASSTIDVAEVKGLLNNTSALPTPGIQLNIGTIYGTQAALRWLPSVDLQNLGKFSLFGFGILHNINSWVPLPLPLDFSLGFFTQKLTVGDVFQSKATQFGLYVSRTIGFGVSVTPYAGITSESATTTIKYDYTFDTPAGPSTQHIQFDLNGENGIGITLGAKLSLFFFNIAADYKIAKTNTATAAMFFGF